MKSIILPNGINVNPLQAKAKLAERQFPGNPERAIIELVSNAIDSNEDLLYSDRTVQIHTSANSVSVQDCGSGMSIERIRMLNTIGGTTKNISEKTIGKLGIGFISLFNRDFHLDTIGIKSRVDDDSYIEMNYYLAPDAAKPFTYRSLTQEEIKCIDYSTNVEVIFAKGYENKVNDCVSLIEKRVQYFPCKIYVNHVLLHSNWRKRNVKYFEDGSTTGISEFTRYSECKITVLSRYERILKTNLNALLKNRQREYNLDDFFNFPYVTNTDIILNNNLLNVCISRDSYYLDVEHYNMVNSLRMHLIKEFNAKSDTPINNIMANIFIFRNEIKNFLGNQEYYSHDKDFADFIKTLATTAVFKMKGSQKLFSAVEIKKLLTPRYPLFFSENALNTRWLSSRFKHDFILTPDRFYTGGGADNFYFRLLKGIYENVVVDLNTIEKNESKILKLIEDGILERDSLFPSIRFSKKPRQNSQEENELLSQLEILLNDKNVINTISSTIALNISTINPMFYTVENKEAYLCTGLFTEGLEAISTEQCHSNLHKENEIDEAKLPLVLGVNKNHSIVKSLLTSNNSHKAYYLISVLAQELVASQKRLLLGHSKYFDISKNKLTADLRRVLIDKLAVA